LIFLPLAANFITDVNYLLMNVLMILLDTKFPKIILSPAFIIRTSQYKKEELNSV
jgi:hypothetical protein